MRVPGYEWKPVSGLDRDPRLNVVHGLILHVDGGNASSLYHWFDGPSGGIESHLFLPKSPSNDKEQFRDTTREADANYKANSWLVGAKRHGFVSLETQGTGSGKWTKYQLDEIKDLIIVLHDEHKFPLQVCPSYHGFGVGYHTLFPEWTNVRGKECPGPARKEQFRTILAPWIDEQRKSRKQLYYTTKANDTVPTIAKKFDTTVGQLWRWNPDVNPPFKPGTRLRVR